MVKSSKPTPRRTRTPSADVEQALLDAAVRLLADEGPSGLSVRKIARAAGVAPMGVYNHFEGKNGIVDEVCRQGFVELGDALAVMGAEADPQEALKLGGLAYRSVAHRHPTTYAVMFLAAVPGYEPSDTTHQAAETAFGSLVDTIARGIQAGALREGDPVELAQMVWSTIHGAVSLELAGIGFCEDLDGLYERLLDMIVDGLSLPH
jgi:AcrR family transcriptional regulator